MWIQVCVSKVNTRKRRIKNITALTTVRNIKNRRNFFFLFFIVFTRTTKKEQRNETVFLTTFPCISHKLCIFFAIISDRKSMRFVVGSVVRDFRSCNSSTGTGGKFVRLMNLEELKTHTD